MNPKQKQTNAGFTLVEILAVLSIVSLLTVISLAVFSHAREKGRSVVCLNNQQQMALAIAQYTQDSGGYFPPEATRDPQTGTGQSADWKQLITPYLKSDGVFSCPSSSLREDNDYAYNWLQLNRTIRSPDGNPRYSRYVGKHESVQEEGSRILLTFDNASSYGDGTSINGRTIETPCGEGLVSDLHSGGANASFVDGHVKWQSIAEQAKFYCARFRD